MSDFSLTTLFVVPASQTTLPSTGGTQNLTPGQVGFFDNTYTVQTSGSTLAAAPYFYIAQGRTNNYLQGSKRSDKINSSAVSELYKVTGSATAATQTTVVSNFNVKGGDVVTLTIRAHSSYLDTLYLNGFTRSVTVQAPCLACGADPCGSVDVPTLIDSLIFKLTQQAPGINPDNITLNQLFQFDIAGSGSSSTLVITGKPLTAYGQPCDIAAFPFEYDRMYFRVFVYTGPATTADFIVADACNIIATETVTQRASYPQGSSAEIAQLEKNFYSYQAGYLKHLYRMNGYNENFESWVTSGTVYDTYYIKFNNVDKSAYEWGAYVHQDSMVILAVPQSSDFQAVSGTATTSSTTLTVVSATGITTGQSIAGPGIPAGTTITGVSGTTLTLSQSASVPASSVLTITSGISGTIHTLLSLALGPITDDSAPNNSTTSTTTIAQPTTTTTLNPVP